jgi:hypothetical protein
MTLARKLNSFDFETFGLNVIGVVTKMNLLLTWLLVIMTLLRLFVTGQIFITIKDTQVNGIWILLSSLANILFFNLTLKYIEYLKTDRSK